MNIPDEAVQAAQATYMTFGIDDGMMREALTAAAPFLQGVKVKALEWREDNFPKSYISKSGAITYSVFWDDDAEWNDIAAPYYLILGEDDGDTLGRFETPEAAKAAAQADYEKRILSALEGVDTIDTLSAPSPRAQAEEILAAERARYYALEEIAAGLVERTDKAETQLAAAKKALADIADHDLICLKDPYRTILQDMINTARAALEASHDPR